MKVDLRLLMEQEPYSQSIELKDALETILPVFSWEEQVAKMWLDQQGYYLKGGGSSGPLVVFSPAGEPANFYLHLELNRAENRVKSSRLFVD